MEAFGRKSNSSTTARGAAANAGSGEQRFAPRRPGQLPAQIYLEGGVQSISCLIRDMSTTGAKLEVREGWDRAVPQNSGQFERIRLVIRQDRVMYDCKVIRRSETELGVKFLAAPKPITKHR